MENQEVFQKALKASYRFLARRPHSQLELKRKLAQKGFASLTIESVIAKIRCQGYINDEDVSLRWACSLVEKRGWGRSKIAHFLLNRGISRDIIEKVQHQVWQEFDESTIARRVIERHFSKVKTPPTIQRKARFLESRGFSPDVIYRIIR